MVRISASSAAMRTSTKPARRRPKNVMRRTAKGEDAALGQQRGEILRAPRAGEGGGVDLGERVGLVAADLVDGDARRATASASSPGDPGGRLRLGVGRRGGRADAALRRRAARRDARRQSAAMIGRGMRDARCAPPPRRRARRRAHRRRSRRSACCQPRRQRECLRRADRGARLPRCRRRRSSGRRSRRARRRDGQHRDRRRARARAASAWTASVEMPTASAPVTSARPRAAAMPTRRPVNEPGPTVTAMRSRSAKARPASAIASAIMPISRSAWPRRAISERRTAGVAGDDADRAGFERGVDGEQAHGRRD